MTPRRPYAIYAITRHGVAIAARLAAHLPGADVLVPDKLRAAAPAGALPLPLPLPIGPFLATAFPAYDCHVFIISVGAVVRLIAPLLVDKKVDPAVVCIDDDARFAICVLSGHVGRGNAFTARVAEALAAQPVITTASDVRGTLTVDILGRDLGWQLDDPDRNVTRGCAAVVNAAPVMFVQDTGEPSWWPETSPLPEGVSYTTALDEIDPARFEILLIASDRELRDSHPAHWASAVIYRPKSLILGLGCDRGTPTELVARGIASLLARHGLSPRSVKAIATIDKKRDEVAFLELCERHGWPLITYAAEELDAVPGIANPSDVVKHHVGTRGVAEPAALLAAGSGALVVPKQRYTEPGAGRSMTLAVARIAFPPRRPPAARTTSNTTPGATVGVTPEVTPGVTPEVTPAVTINVTPEVTPGVTPEVTINVTPEVTPGVTPEVTPGVTPEVTINVTPGATHAVTPEVTPGVTPEMTINVTPGATHAVTIEVTPAVTGNAAVEPSRAPPPQPSEVTP